MKMKSNLKTNLKTA